MYYTHIYNVLYIANLWVDYTEVSHLAKQPLLLNIRTNQNVFYNKFTKLLNNTAEH